MPKKAAIFALKLLITVGLFVLLFRPQTFGLRPDIFGAITPGKLIDEIRSVDAHNILFWLLFATVVKLAGMLCGVLRWRLLLKGQGLRMPFWYMVQSWFIGRTIGIFLPGTIGLDGYRLYDSSRYTGDVIKSTTVIAIEKLIGIIALTLLVFLTFPLGFRLLSFNVPLLIIAMTIFGGLVVVSLLTLLNPRVIQVLVAAIPTPGAVRGIVNRLGSAVTAYGGNRSSLLLAVVFGILVHVGTCLMYFGTMSAIRAENTTIFDIFFTSPLMIWGTVLGPTVGGEGIREIVFVSVLGAKGGSVQAFLIAHLGWWVGELVPFLIGLPIFLLRKRAASSQMQLELASVREKAAGTTQALLLDPEQIRTYRARLIDCALAGILAGLIAGAVVGMGEASWVALNFEHLSEYGAFWWGALWYGLAFAGVGLGAACALAFLYLLVDRFPRAQTTFALCLAGSLTFGGAALGWWRFKRDILAKHAPSMSQSMIIAFVALAAGLLLGALAWLILSRIRGKRVTGILAGAAAFVALIVVGALVGATAKPAPPAPPALAASPSMGPNILLIAVDALRADYLPMYSADAVAKTPHLDALKSESVFFANAFSQASWTKPSFATIFSGLYPRSHTATDQVAALPAAVVTFPEILQEGGYYTMGYANNANIVPAFNFQQGFAEYKYLAPDLHFGASDSASRLTIYEVLRRVREKIPGKKMAVTDAYQPADVVTEEALDWLRTGRPTDRPFFLFLHYMETHDPFMDWENPGVGYARVSMPDPDPDKFLEPMRKAYNLEIEYLDRYLGELLAGLRELGVYDNTVILFTADHGEEFYDHEGWWHGQTLYDELIHIPLTVKLPGNTGAGTSLDTFARHIDLAPTLLHLAGLKKSEAMPGTPLLDLEGSFVGSEPGYVYAEEDFEGNVLEAVRTYDTKLIRANDENPRGLEPVEFYDLVADPGEQDNLAGQREVEEAALAKTIDEMAEYIENNAAEPQIMSGSIDEIASELEALGYMGGDD